MRRVQSGCWFCRCLGLLRLARGWGLRWRLVGIRLVGTRATARIQDTRALHYPPPFGTRATARVPSPLHPPPPPLQWTRVHLLETRATRAFQRNWDLRRRATPRATLPPPLRNDDSQQMGGEVGLTGRPGG